MLSTTSSWLDALPQWLRVRGPFDLSVWQWFAIPIAVAIGIVLGATASRIVRAALAAGTRRTANRWDDAMLERLGAPLTLALTLVAVTALRPLLGLPAGMDGSARQGTRALQLLGIFWACWRTVDVMRHAALQSDWAARVASSRALVPLGARVAKALLLVMALIGVLSLLGYPVASLLAGLGIGGLAVALAAQKTVENLFGAFSIGVDQPFREGDFVKVDDFVGTVEAIGLRSTRFRTLDRTIITIPNGRLADMRLESFAERDRLRLATVVGLVYDTTADQLRAVRDGFEAVLRSHPRIWADAVIVRFREFAASSLDLEVMAWFQTSDWSEFQRIREDVLVAFMEVVDRAGTSIAFPTRTLHIVNAAVPTALADSGVAAVRN